MKNQLLKMKIIFLNKIILNMTHIHVAKRDERNEMEPRHTVTNESIKASDIQGS